MTSQPESKVYEDPTTGMKWKVRRGTQYGDHLALGGHETAFISICRSVLKPGGTFVDVGAHVGLYSLNLAEKAGKVIAFEANFNTCRALFDNLELNPELGSKVTVYHRAVWHSDNEVVYLVDTNGMDSGGSTRCEAAAGSSHEGEKEVGMVATVKLDTIMDGYPVDLIKIDVEGGERHVLDGATDTLRRSRPYLFIEMHDFMLPDDNRSEIEGRLDALDYDHGTDFPYGNGYHWLCRPKEIL